MAKIQQIHQSQPQKVAIKKPEKAPKTQVNAAQMLEAPETLRPEDVLAAQQQVGNQVVQRALDRNTRSRGLTDQQGNLREDIAGQIQKSRGGGSPLPENVQKEAARKLGRSFGDVRVHTDESADQLSRTIHARAFTIGRDIFFKSGVFAPGSSKGQETLIHELTHVVQQSGKNTGGTLKLGAPDTAHEKEADQMGKKHASAFSAGPAGSSAVQAQEEEDELQKQPEEEELQMQAEEEEVLQAQPDPTVAVQRVKEDEDKNIPKPPPMTPKMQMEGLQSLVAKQFPPLQKKPSTGEKLKGALSGAKRAIQTKVTGVDPQSMEGQLKSKVGSMKSGKGIEALEKTRAGKFKEMQSFSDNPTKEGKLARVPSVAEKKVSSREKLMATIENKSSKPEDVKAAEEKLSMLHKRSKMDTFKSFFKKGGSTKSFAEQAQQRRMENLKKAAEGGDDDAFQKYKEAEAEKDKNSITGKIKGAIGGMGGVSGIAGKVGGLLGGLLGGSVKGAASEYKSHFMGGGKKEEDSDGGDKDKKGESSPAPSSSSSPSSSGMGAGIGAMMEKYGELVKENQALKQQLDELKAKK